MHLIEDENGNLVGHAHTHEHTHTHTYEHSHPHDHEHGHEHEHEHTHEHPHTHDHADGEHTHCGHCAEHTHEHPHTHSHNHAESQGDKLTAVLDYMLKHNEHHAAELDQVAQKFAADGKTNAAEQIKKAVDEFQKGNLYLGLALSMIKEEN